MMVLSRVRYAPPMYGSLIFAKKFPSAVNMSVATKDLDTCKRSKTAVTCHDVVNSGLDEGSN